MAMSDLATPADLTARGVDVSDTEHVSAALASASAAVREAAGSSISQESSTFDVVAGEGQYLQLPTSPIVSVEAVSVDGLTVSDYRLIGGALWRAAGWRGCDPSVVTVDATHGYVVVPADIVDLVCQFAVASMLTAQDGARSGVVGRSESIDDYSGTTQYGGGANGTATALEVPPRTAMMLRQRFGGGAHVTSGR